MKQEEIENEIRRIISNTTDLNPFIDIYLSWLYSQKKLFLNIPNLTEKLSFNNDQNSDNGTEYLNNCKMFYSRVINDYESLIFLINKLSYIIITIGILFNILNLVVLMRTKLNESPYTYLTFLALSDLGALLVISLEKINQLIGYKPYMESFFINVVTPLLNTFLSCSMYVTLALTIERFIFVHMPFRSKSICHRAIARRVCLIIFGFSLLRSLYLPFMYVKSDCISNAWIQKKYKAVDIYEFLVSLAIPYTIIFIVNISLIISLKKQNALMRTSTFSHSNKRRISRKSSTNTSQTYVTIELQPNQERGSYATALSNNHEKKSKKKKKKIKGFN